MEHLALLAECRVGPGRLMLSSMGLSGLQAHVEARALLGAILRHMDTEAFAPRGELTLEALASLFTAE